MKTSPFSPVKSRHGLCAIVLSLVLASLFGAALSVSRAADGNFNNVTVAGNFTLGNATASGNNSLAAGNGAMASGNYSIALGTNVTANTWSSVTVGHYNAAITGNPSAWAAADPAFIVGIGNSTAAANGLVLLNSGLVGIGTNTPGEELEVAGIGRLKLNRPDNGSSGAILQRQGLSQTRRRRPGLFHPKPSALTQPTHPNHVWTVDFKGWFLLQNGERCDALTVCDRFSRYLIGCQARPNQQFTSTLRVFKSLLRHHGKPQIIRVDNGSPFASLGLGRLSQLSIWWIEQGITVEFTRPGHPQDNGSHERMHRDLKAEVAQPPSTNLRAQQRRLERWQYRYNHERPHEALKMQKPAQLYHRSQRRLRENDNLVRYPATHLVKQISTSGHLHHESRNYYVGEAFACSRVGLFVNKAGQTELHFANVHLGNLNYDPAAR